MLMKIKEMKFRNYIKVKKGQKRAEIYIINRYII